MLEWLKRTLGGSTSTRSYDAASGGRRWNGNPGMVRPVTVAHAARHTLAARARYAVSNNPLAASGLEAWVTSLVGVGVKAQSQHTDPLRRKDISQRFEDWTDFADADGLTDFYGLQASIARSVVVTGEAFVLLINDPDGLRLRLVDPEQVDASYTVVLSATHQVIQGVEFDAAGRRTAYHLFAERPGQFGDFGLKRIRVAAEDMVHVFRPLWPGMVRGISWFAPVLLRMTDLDETRDAQQVRQKVGALLTGWIKNTDGSGAPLDGTSANGVLSGAMTPGALTYLSANEEIVFSTPPTIGMDSIAFMRLSEREIAVGLGIPGYLLHGDLSDVNFSSIRAGLIAFRERVEALQYSMLVFMALRPIFERWATLEVLSGRMTGTVAETLPAKWVTPRTTWVDPLKDAQAEILAISNGLKSRREAAASRGVDVELLDEEIAADRQRETSLGLTFPAPVNDNRPPVEDAAA